MFNLERLVVTSLPTEESGPIVEACGDYNEALKDFFICIPSSSIPEVVAYIETLANNAYMLRLMNKDPVKGLRMLIANEHAESYTTELIKYYGGVQELIDVASGKQSSEMKDFVVTDSADNAVFSGDAADAPTDYVPVDAEPQDLVEESETEVFEEDSYNSVSVDGEAVTASPVTSVATPTTMDLNGELYLMIRGIAQVLGLTEFDDTRTLTIEDLQEARVYITNLSSLSIREGILAVLDQINTKADLRMITRFLELFIMYLKQNDIRR